MSCPSERTRIVMYAAPVDTSNCSATGVPALASVSAARSDLTRYERESTPEWLMLSVTLVCHSSLFARL